MSIEEIGKKIEYLEEKKWFLELADEVNTKEYVDICFKLQELKAELKEKSHE